MGVSSAGALFLEIKKKEERKCLSFCYYYYHFYSVKELGFLSYLYSSINGLFTRIIKYIYEQLMCREASRTTAKSNMEQRNTTESR